MDLQTALTGFQTKQRKVLEPVDHGKIQYEPYRKNFYVEVPELTRMTQEGQLIKLISSSPTTEYLIQKKRLIELRGHACNMCVVQMSSSCTHSNTNFCRQCVQRCLPVYQAIWAVYEMSSIKREVQVHHLIIFLGLFTYSLIRYFLI